MKISEFPNEIFKNRSLCTTGFFETSQVVLEGLQFPSGKYANGLVYFVENPWQFKMKRLYDCKKKPIKYLHT